MKRLLLIVTVLLSGLTAAHAQTDNTVTIAYNGNSATVTVASNISSYVTVQSGTSSHVKLVQSESVDALVGEITYTLSGSSTDGEFYMEGSYKASVELNGLTLTNPSGPAINIQNGKRIKLSAKNGTVSTLTDGVNADYNGCVHCKGHLELKGKGTLNVVGNSKHGIYSKEYMQMKNLTLNVTAATKDAIHCKEYFLMENGTVNLTGATDDGIQVEIDTDIPTTGITTDHEEENTGNFYMLDGTLTISGYQGKAIKADGTITYSGGQQNFDTSDTEMLASVGYLKVAPSAAGATQLFDLRGHQYKSSGSLSKGFYVVRKDGKSTKVLVK